MVQKKNEHTRHAITLQGVLTVVKNKVSFLLEWCSSAAMAVGDLEVLYIVCGLNDTFVYSYMLKNSRAMPVKEKIGRITKNCVL
jgi:hypothetical protein